MINSVLINNFKSINNLDLTLGRFNVLIGANGSGKSNILEAIAFGGAATADRLDNEFLSSRGIRGAEPKTMKSLLPDLERQKDPIKIIFKSDLKQDPIFLTIEEDIDSPFSWKIQQKEFIKDEFLKVISGIVESNKETIDSLKFNTDEEKEKLKNFSTTLSELMGTENKKIVLDSVLKVMGGDTIKNVYEAQFSEKNINNFLVYSPEETTLKKLDEEGQIKPLGRKGEGLFNQLQSFAEKNKINLINDLKDFLHVIEWFDDFETIIDKTSGRKALVIKDRFIKNVSLHQNNVNEGFLYVLFYLTLFVSDDTPAFFAIDNIEASFHPKLCTELIRHLVKLSKKFNKQVILTTHNPFILDGLDLNDPEQKLYSISRNPDGETIAHEAKNQPKNVLLSEAWMAGYIGGNPITF